MNIGDYVLYEDNEYTIEAKTLGGDKVKISRIAHNQGWLKRSKTITRWTDRVNVIQILTIIGDEEAVDEEETLVHSYRAELKELIEAIEVMKHQSPQHHFLKKYEEMIKGDFHLYYRDARGWLFYNTKDDAFKNITAPTLEGIIKKVNKL